LSEAEVRLAAVVGGKLVAGRWEEEEEEVSSEDIVCVRWCWQYMCVVWASGGQAELKPSL
jgi:hypothetical protein